MQTDYTVSALSTDRSTSFRVCEILRQMILTQKLSPGDRLVEAKTAKALQVSITPVRQAFTLLVSQGLLTAFPYRGTYVTILTKEYAADIANTRKVLEPAAAKMAFDSLKPSDADYLYKMCEFSDISESTGDLLTSIDYDIQFHEFFFQKCGNVLMQEIWSSLKNRIIFFQCITRADCQASSPLLTNRHKKIINAVRDMDQDALTSALLDHLDNTLRRAALPSSSEVVYK